MAREQYEDQLHLLLDILPLVMAEPAFALKGGTAINLFERDLPRLSIDIDLTYLPIQERAASLTAIGQALARIKTEIERRFPLIRVVQTRQGRDGMEVKLNCQRGKTQIKVEVNPTLRGHLLPVRDLPCSDRVQEKFEAFVEARCVSHGELFGGKICAALDRQHPRDLFDVKLLLDAEGLVDEVRYGLIASLVSHARPVSELIRPRQKDQSATFKAQFEGMPFEPFTYEDHRQTFDGLVIAVNAAFSAQDREFLESFEAGDPQWSCFPWPGIADLPAPQFKLMNIRKFRDQQPDRHEAGLVALRHALA